MAEPRQLHGWKEIARFLDASERSVKRWEETRSLPVHRVPGRGRDAVFAATDELTAWRSQRKADLSAEDVVGFPPAPPAAETVRPNVPTVFRWRSSSIAVGVAAVAFCIALAGYTANLRPGSTVTPPSAGTDPLTKHTGNSSPGPQPITLRVTRPEGSPAVVGVAPGACAKFELQAAAVELCPQLTGETLLLQVRLASEGGAVRRGTRLLLERDVTVRVLDPAPFDVEWLSQESASPVRR